MSLYTVSITNASGPNSVTIDTSTTPNSINISDGSTLAALSVNTNVSTPLLSDSNPTLSADLNLNGNDITGSGDITTTGNVTLTGDMVVSGDLTVNGTTTTLNTQTLDVEDINITVAYGAATPAAANGAGLTVDGADATLIYQSAGDNWALNKALDVSGNVTVSGTVDGRDVAADGTKLDGIEASADVTDTSNVTAAGALMDSEVANLAQVKAFNSADYATASQGAAADAALPKSGGAMTGPITTTSTFDGRDVATDGVKLDGIEALADVTDAANVTAAGALMDSEVTNLAQVKAFDETDYATAAQGTLADSAVQNNDSPTFDVVTATSFSGDGSALTGLPSGYTDADVDTHLNTSTATTDQVLSWSGSDYDWVDAGGSTTAGAVGTYVWATPAASDLQAAQFVFGSTYAGTGLYPAGFASLAASTTTAGTVKYTSGNSIGVMDTSVSALSGTWRCMAQTPPQSSSHDEQPTALFVRIS